MDTIRAKYVEINKRIFNNRDGEILQMQKEYGTTYTKSLGVSILSLENIAKDYEASHQLAGRVGDSIVENGDCRTLGASYEAFAKKIAQY